MNQENKEIIAQLIDSELGDAAKEWHQVAPMASALMSRATGKRVRFQATTESSQFTSGVGCKKKKYRYERIETPKAHKPVEGAPEADYDFMVFVSLRMPRERLSQVLRLAVRNILKGKPDKAGLILGAGGVVDSVTNKLWKATGAESILANCGWVPVIPTEEALAKIAAANAKRTETKAANAAKAEEAKAEEDEAEEAKAEEASVETKEPNKPKADKEPQVLIMLTAGGLNQPVTVSGEFAKAMRDTGMVGNIDEQSYQLWLEYTGDVSLVDASKKVAHEVKGKKNGSALNGINQAAKEAV